MHILITALVVVNGPFVLSISMANSSFGGDWENSAGKEGTDKGDKSASGQCDGDTHLDIYMVVKHGLCRPDTRDE